LTKRFAPATQRNREAISDVLAGVLPSSGLALEIASGSGEHVIHFAARFPGLIWQPSDDDEDGIASISSWREDVDLPNILPPVRLDVRQDIWPVREADVILCINMVHISPWSASEGLCAGAGRVLPSGGLLYLYGPYLEADVATAASNLEFDASLIARNPEWGLRKAEDIIALAQKNGLAFVQRTAMPANNISLVFRRV
jgi:Protein of unknown function (DUF938)